MAGGAFALGTSATPAAAQSSSPWTIVSIPDTQKYAESSSLISYAQDQTSWIANNVGSENIAFVTHVGDIVEHGDDVTEWERMDGVMSTLNGAVPYSTLLGNHDYAVLGDRNSSIENYRTYFGSSRYNGYGWFGGAAPDDRGYYQRFSGGGYDFLHLALEWGVPGSPSNGSTVMGWAQDVLDANPDTPTVITTHAYLWDKSGSEGHATRRDGANSGQNIFQELVSPNPQVFMVLNGHYHRTDGEYAQVSQNDASLDVYEMLTDYQNYGDGGNGWMRLIEFVPGGGSGGTDRIRARTYSPSLDQFQTDGNSQFAFDLSFDERFNNIPSEEPPASDTRILTLESPDGSGVNYEFTVSGDTLEKSTAYGASTNNFDTISGSTATGYVGTGRDSYEFSGDVTSLSANGALTTYIDGEEVDLGGNGGELTVTTADVSNVAETSATLNGSLDDLGGASSADVSFEYRSDGESTWTEVSAGTLDTTGSFSQDVTDLSSGTAYEFRALASTADASTTGESMAFETAGGSGNETRILTLESTDGSGVNYEFTVSGDVLGKSAAYDASINNSDTISGSTATGYVGSGRDSYEFSGDVSDLSANGDLTTYIDGEVVDFGGDVGSGIQTLTLESPDGSGVNYEFTVSGDTLEKSTAYGASIQSNDTISGSTATGYVGTGRDSYEFSGDVTSISASGDLTTYIDGEAVDLGGGDGGTPTLAVTTLDASNVTETAATLNGSLDDLGGASSADVAFEYRPDGESTWTETGTESLTATGSFSQDVTDLASATAYEVRAVATTADASTTGDTLTFETAGGGSSETRILTLESPDGSGVNYEFTVSGDTLEKSTAYSASIQSNDTISGSTATGYVGTGRDSYEFSGDVSDLSANGDLTTYIDGEVVDFGGDVGSGIQTLTLESPDGSGVNYEFSVSGDTLQKSTAYGASTQSNDTISGSTATGYVGTGRDSYEFSGDVTSISASGDLTTYIDGEAVDLGGGDGGSDTTTLTVTTADVSNVAETSATLNGSLDDLGGASSADVAFEYRPDGESTWTETGTESLAATGSFSQDVTDLASATAYEVRAVATTADASTTGDTLTFETSGGDGGDGTPTLAVTTLDASNVTETAATLNGSLDDLGGASSADVAFEYRPDGESTWTETGTESLTATGSFSQDVTDLTNGTAYEVRAVAQTSDTSTTGGTTTFTTTSSGSGESETRIITLESPDGSRVDYEFTVSGDTLEKSSEYDASINNGDTISGNTASGTVYGGRDSFEFSGDVSSLSADGDLTTYIDGEQVTLG